MRAVLLFAVAVAAADVAEPSPEEQAGSWFDKRRYTLKSDYAAVKADRLARGADVGGSLLASNPVASPEAGSWFDKRRYILKSDYEAVKADRAARGAEP